MQGARNGVPRWTQTGGRIRLCGAQREEPAMYMLRSPARILVLLALLVVGPNLLWVSRSSVALHNAADEPLAVRLILSGAPEQIIDAGTLAPGARQFMWIAPTGEATLSVEVQAGIGWERNCAAYVEPGMYRVAITIDSAEKVTCETTQPIFKRLLVRDVLQ